MLCKDGTNTINRIHSTAESAVASLMFSFASFCVLGQVQEVMNIDLTSHVFQSHTLSNHHR